MKVEVKDDYCTGNYAMVGGGKDWFETEELPTEDITKLKAYKKLDDGTLEFDEERYNSLLEDEKNIILIQTKQSEILNLQEELNSTDYKIIKCYEYNLTNNELPYDINELHTERQTIRDKINNIEEEIKSLANMLGSFVN